MFQNKRKAFDSKAARVEGTEAEKFVAGKGKKGAGASAAPAKAGKKNAWEQKSNQLREAMKAARMYKKAVESGM